MTSAATGVRAAPCRHFRDKRMFVAGQTALVRVGPPAATAPVFCWCTRTLTALGADDRPVAWAACSRPERACYAPPGPTA